MKNKKLNLIIWATALVLTASVSAMAQDYCERSMRLPLARGSEDYLPKVADGWRQSSFELAESAL